MLLHFDHATVFACFVMLCGCNTEIAVNGGFAF